MKYINAFSSFREETQVPPLFALDTIMTCSRSTIVVAPQATLLIIREADQGSVRSGAASREDVDLSAPFFFFFFQNEH